MTNRISLRELEVSALIGVHEWEQEVAQKLLLNVDLNVDCSTAAATDNLQDALDYEQIANCILSFAAKHHFQLLESFASTLADELVDRFKPERITLEVTKSCVTPTPFSVSVSISRP